MTKRRRRQGGEPGQHGEGGRRTAGRARPASPPREPDALDRASRAPWWRTFVAQVGILAAVFAVTVVVAELAGAANLGVALGIGQIVFAGALMYLLLRR